LGADADRREEPRRARGRDRTGLVQTGEDPKVRALTRVRIAILSSMNPAELRDHCLSFGGAEETFPFGPNTSVFKVGGKIFALSQLEARPLRVSLKCEPALAEALRRAYAAVVPGYHLNKRHWNTVTIDGSLPEQMIRELIEDSYDLVAG
jgi:predicted DNA-binding protein (MmcQ/YjbR family)